MSDNVFIFGAGLSFDANVPLLSNFIDKMWYLLQCKISEGQNESDKEFKILSRAMQIRSKLDGYHGRINYDDRNIEEILSILYFNGLETGSTENEIYAFNRAIALTIESLTNIKENDIATSNMQSEGLYTRFWRYLFRAMQTLRIDIPTIISFNYDLVLERSLFTALQVNLRTNQYDFKLEDHFPFKSFSIDYAFNHFLPIKYSLDFNRTQEDQGRNAIYSSTLCKQDDSFLVDKNINILKLHGSLNFKNNFGEERSYTKASDSPIIIPPTTNKQLMEDSTQMWVKALQELRSAKNIIFVGYSMPETDTYLHSFLKAAIGPNQNLQDIYVYDPIIFEKTNRSEEMIKRFNSLFSIQQRKKVHWGDGSIDIDEIPKSNHYGKTSDFINILGYKPEEILYHTKR